MGAAACCAGKKKQPVKSQIPKQQNSQIKEEPKPQIKSQIVVQKKISLKPGSSKIESYILSPDFALPQVPIIKAYKYGDFIQIQSN